MNQTPAKCEFCKRPGNLTKSHIWPEWSQLVVPPVGADYEITIGAPMQTFKQIVPGPKLFQKVKPGSTAKRQPRNTCFSCNNGWMREVEESAKFTVSKFMLGHDRIIPPMEQWFLASFLCLASMRVERSSDMRAIPDGDVSWLREKREPPPNWWIAISHYVEAKDPQDYWVAYLAMRRTLSFEPMQVGPKDCNTQVTTIVAGQLCAHIFSSSVWEDFRGYEGADMTQIWPPRYLPIDTRAIRYIDNAGLPWLHEAVAREGKQTP